jgi:hypothetical protein
MTTKAEDITLEGKDSWFTQNLTKEMLQLLYQPVETVTAAGAASIWGVTILDSASAATNMTLADGEQIGQRKTFVMKDATNSSTVSVTKHVTSDPEVFTFAQVGDALELIWDGAEWATLANANAAT